MKIRSKHLLAISAIVGLGSYGALVAKTEYDIDSHHRGVVASALTAPAPAAIEQAELPAPVQRYFDFTFRQAPAELAHVELSMEGQFRRPLTENFIPASVSQTIAAGTPALMFDGTAQMIPGVWARFYDAYVGGEMDMRAKLLSAFTVGEWQSSPELNRISLRRWLLESPLYPVALLPGGPVRWEAIDEHRARAVASFGGMSASMVASFAEDGRLLDFRAESDGDLSTPYHGSGEYVARSDYRLVDGMMIPMAFSIARAAGGEIYPFWKGRVTDIRFNRAGEQDQA